MNKENYILNFISSNNEKATQIMPKLVSNNLKNYLVNKLQECNYKKIKNINSPIFVMHGEVDQIVPFSMGKKIYEIANEPKYSYFTKYDNHMMEFDEKLVYELTLFIESLN